MITHRSYLFLIFLCHMLTIQLACTAESHCTEYQFSRTNNNNLQQCLSRSLPVSVRTIYPCVTLMNQNTSQYQCDHFYVSGLANIRRNRTSHFPAVIVYARDSMDVQSVVKCADKLNYTVNVLSGGHGYERYGLGTVYNNIIVNMEKMNYIDIDTIGGTARIGPGARIGPIYYKTYQYNNYTINGGVCPWVGLGGHVLGGGQGYLVRLHGLLSDNVLEMKAVTAQGDLLTINETDEFDLFWALRGAGGGLFVIVTEFKIRLIRAPSLVTTFSLTWYQNVTKLVIQRYQSVLFNHEKLPLSNNLFLQMLVSHNFVTIIIIYYGSELEEFDRIMMLFLCTLPSADKIEVRQEDWLAFVYQMSRLDSGSKNYQELLLENLTYPTVYFKAKHLFYDRPISDDSLDQLVNCLALGDERIYLQYNFWEGYVSTIPVDRTAFPHRLYKFSIQFMILWDDEKPEQQQMNRLNQVYLSIYNDSTKHAYINYIDRDVDNWMDVYYHMHKERLIHIKNIYDRNNRFYFERTLS